VDGVPRTVRVGAVLDGELRLLAVNRRSASLGQGGVVSLTLQIMPAAPAATGSLQPAAPSPVVLGGAPMMAPGLPAQMPTMPPPMPPAPPQMQEPLPSPVGQQTR
jgi:general secretion pathway protein C